MQLPDGTVPRTKVWFMPDTLVGTIIHIDEQRFPIGSQCIIIYRITVVLTGNETTFRSYHAHRLVMAAMTVFQFIDGGASCFWKATDSPYKCRKIGLSLRLIALRICCTASSQVSGSPGPFEINNPSYSIPVKSHGSKEHGSLPHPVSVTTDNICLYTTIHQHHFFLPGTFIVTNYFLTRYFIYIIDTCIRCFGHIAGFIIKYDFPHHTPCSRRTLVSSRVSMPCNARHFAHASASRPDFLRIPVTVFFTVITYNNRFGMDTFTFHKSSQTIGFDSKGGTPVITDQRIS